MPERLALRRKSLSAVEPLKQISLIIYLDGDVPIRESRLPQDSQVRSSLFLIPVCAAASALIEPPALSIVDTSVSAI